MSLPFIAEPRLTAAQAADALERALAAERPTVIHVPE